LNPGNAGTVEVKLKQLISLFEPSVTVGWSSST